MKKNLPMIISLVVLAVVLIGGFTVVKGRNASGPAPSPESEIEIESLPPVDPSVVVKLTPSSDGKSVDLSIQNIPANTLSIEYELTYLTGEGLPKGALGKINLDAGETDIERNILLGTCSKNTCTYDAGVKSVNLVLKFNSPQGASQFTSEYPLE